MARSGRVLLKGALRRERRGLSFAVICLAGCGDLAQSSAGAETFPPGSEVRVEPAMAHGLSTDETPVRTDLYPYRLGDRYITTGPPVSFVFPKSAYASRENMRGGPQSMVLLRIDRRTMQPIGRLLKAMPEWPSNDIWRAYQLHFVRRDLHVAIYSNAHGATMSEQERHLNVVLGLGQVAARVCGFELRPGRIIYPGGSPRATIAGTELPPATYAGRAIAEGSPSRTVRCVQDSHICLVSFGLADRIVNYSVPTAELCDHDRITRQLRGLLNRHRTR